MEDNSGRRRLSDFDDQAFLAAVEQNDRLATRMLAENATCRSFHNCTPSPKTGEGVEITRMGAT